METKHKITLEKNKVELTISDMRDKDTRGAGHDRQGRAAASPKLESKIVSAKKKTAHHQHHNQQEHNNKKNNNDDRSICWQHKTDREDNDYCRDHYDDRDLVCSLLCKQQQPNRCLFNTTNNTREKQVVLFLYISEVQMLWGVGYAISSFTHVPPPEILLPAP